MIYIVQATCLADTKTELHRQNSSIIETKIYPLELSTNLIQGIAKLNNLLNIEFLDNDLINSEFKTNFCQNVGQPLFITEIQQINSGAFLLEMYKIDNQIIYISHPEQKVRVLQPHEFVIIETTFNVRFKLSNSIGFRQLYIKDNKITDNLENNENLTCKVPKSMRILDQNVKLIQHQVNSKLVQLLKMEKILNITSSSDLIKCLNINFESIHDFRNIQESQITDCLVNLGRGRRNAIDALADLFGSNEKMNMVKLEMNKVLEVFNNNFDNLNKMENDIERSFQHLRLEMRDISKLGDILYGINLRLQIREMRDSKSLQFQLDTMLKSNVILQLLKETRTFAEIDFLSESLSQNTNKKQECQINICKKILGISSDANKITIQIYETKYNPAQIVTFSCIPENSTSISEFHLKKGLLKGTTVLFDSGKEFEIDKIKNGNNSLRLILGTDQLIQDLIIVKNATKNGLFCMKLLKFTLNKEKIECNAGSFQWTSRDFEIQIGDKSFNFKHAEQHFSQISFHEQKSWGGETDILQQKYDISELNSLISNISADLANQHPVNLLFFNDAGNLSVEKVAGWGAAGTICTILLCLILFWKSDILCNATKWVFHSICRKNIQNVPTAPENAEQGTEMIPLNRPHIQLPSNPGWNDWATETRARHVTGDQPSERVTLGTESETRANQCRTSANGQQDIQAAVPPRPPKLEHIKKLKKTED